MDKKELKKTAKKVWWFIWESDSIWSWIVNIILAFVIIKFLVYPGLGLALGTTYPVVAVVSSSMEHDGSFDQWWESAAFCGDSNCNQAIYYENFNISKKDFLNFKFKNGFNKGDIMLLKGTEPKNIGKGDIIVFRSIRPDPIIHRVINVDKENDAYYFQTKGDHNKASYINLKENSIHEDRVIGKAILRIPYVGWIKIIAIKIWYFIMPR